MRWMGLVPVVAMTLAACSADSYDEGTGAFSLTQADFVELHSAAKGVADRAVTDDGRTLTLAPPLSAEWLTTPDSTYRAVLYYNLTDGNRAETVAASQVPTLRPRPLEEGDVAHTDPVRFESMWMSAGGKYLNIGMYIKTGRSGDGGALQTIGMIDDGTTDNPDGTVTANMRLFHDQGGVPEYYSSRLYVSMACRDIAADSISVTLVSYDGTVNRRFALGD